MNAHESLAADIALFHADPAGTAEAVTWTPSGGEASTLQAAVIRTGFMLDEFQDGQWEIETGQLYASGASANAIGMNDTFGITPAGGGSAQTWKVRQVGVYLGGVREILIVRQIRKALIGQTDQTHRGRGRSYLGAG